MVQYQYGQVCYSNLVRILIPALWYLLHLWYLSLILGRIQ